MTVVSLAARRGDDALPEPLTPADCDLRGMLFMPLDVRRLTSSDFAALSTAEEFKAAVLLWCAAWEQVPAASLPDDDRLLAHLSGAGTRWRKVKAGALRGWIRCADGRLYHPVVAEKARIAWEARLAQRARTEAARSARAARRGQDPAAVRDAGKPTVRPAGASVTMSVTENVTDIVTGSKGEGEGERELKDSPSNTAVALPRTRAGAGRGATGPMGSALPADWKSSRQLPRPWWDELAWKDGEHWYAGLRERPKGLHPDFTTACRLDVAEELVLDEAELPVLANTSISTEALARWLSEGLCLHEIILPAIRAAKRKPGYRPPGSLRFFEGFVRTEAQRQKARMFWDLDLLTPKVAAAS